MGRSRWAGGSSSTPGPDPPCCPLPPCCPPAAHAAQIYNSSDTVYYKLAAKLQGVLQQILAASVLPVEEPAE